VTVTRSSSAALLLIVGLTGLTGCSPQDDRGDYAARYGESALPVSEVVSALSNAPPGLDSAQAYEQYVERWIAEELLAEEARRRSIQDEPEVRRLLREGERSILISSLVERLYEDMDPPTESQIQEYFSQNQDKLALRESFVRIRYLSTGDSAAAVEAHETLETLDASTAPDSLWQEVILRHASDTSVAVALSSSYFPVSRLFRNTPELAQIVNSTVATGAIAPITSLNGEFHVLQIVDRLPAGTSPRMEWVRDDIYNRLMIEARKQLYIDHVQRLKNRALANGDLDIPGQDGFGH
jgi:hypothetical protein